MSYVYIVVLKTNSLACWCVILWSWTNFKCCSRIECIYIYGIL